MPVSADDLPLDGPSPGMRRRPDSADRRSADRRTGRRGRRSDDRKSETDTRNLAALGVLLAAGASLLAVAAYLRPPISYAPGSECPTDGFNGQVQAHRGLSALWVGVMMLCALSVAVPMTRRRPAAVILLCGLSVGLLGGAVLRVDTWLIGYCFS